MRLKKRIGKIFLRQCHVAGSKRDAGRTSRSRVGITSSFEALFRPDGLGATILKYLSTAAAETRRILCDRFARYLPVTQNGGALPSQGVLLRDELPLKLSLISGRSWKAMPGSPAVNVSYDVALAKNPGEPVSMKRSPSPGFGSVWGRPAPLRDRPEGTQRARGHDDALMPC